MDRKSMGFFLGIQSSFSRKSEAKRLALDVEGASFNRRKRWGLRGSKVVRRPPDLVLGALSQSGSVMAEAVFDPVRPVRVQGGTELGGEQYPGGAVRSPGMAWNRPRAVGTGAVDGGLEVCAEPNALEGALGPGRLDPSSKGFQIHEASRLSADDRLVGLVKAIDPTGQWGSEDFLEALKRSGRPVEQAWMELSIIVELIRVYGIQRGEAPDPGLALALSHGGCGLDAETVRSTLRKVWPLEKAFAPRSVEEEAQMQEEANRLLKETAAGACFNLRSGTSQSSTEGGFARFLRGFWKNPAPWKKNGVKIVVGALIFSVATATIFLKFMGQHVTSGYEDSKIMHAMDAAYNHQGHDGFSLLSDDAHMGIGACEGVYDHGAKASHALGQWDLSQASKECGDAAEAFGSAEGSVHSAGVDIRAGFKQLPSDAQAWFAGKPTSFTPAPSVEAITLSPEDAEVFRGKEYLLIPGLKLPSLGSDSAAGA